MSEKSTKPNTAQGRNLLEERQLIIGNIDASLASIPFEDTLNIEHVRRAEEGNLGATITKHQNRGPKGSRTWQDPRFGGVLEINGSVTKDNGEKSEPFPMYRVTGVQPGTDSGYLTPHYEIAVAEEGSYRPIALVMQSILRTSEEPRVQGSPRIAYGPFDESVKQLAPEDLTELKETGIYVDPNARAQLDEVYTIMELGIAQAAVGPDQPTLPLDFAQAA
jgi:hypothetical protein